MGAVTTDSTEYTSGSDISTSTLRGRERGGERKRERERERGTERGTERERDREREGQRERERGLVAKKGRNKR
jgi:hypothetical protein